jgi:hypothetical protein
VDLATWNPIHSKAVKEILAHAAPHERRRFAVLSAVAGLVLAVNSFIIILPALGMAYYTELQPFSPAQWAMVIGGMAIGFGILGITLLFIRRTVRTMLVEFEWAREQGITKETLKLNRWP